MSIVSVTMEKFREGNRMGDEDGNRTFLIQICMRGPYGSSSANCDGLAIPGLVGGWMDAETSGSKIKATKIQQFGMVTEQWPSGEEPQEMAEQDAY